MNILVTGGAGFIGTHFIKRMMDGLHNVVAIDNFHPYYAGHRKREQMEHVIGQGEVTIYEGNIMDEPFCFDILCRHSIDTVVHLAAIPGVSYSIQQPMEYIDNNIKGTVSILKAAGMAGIRHFIFASSSSVYGDQTGKPLSEEMANGVVVSPYAASKVSGEAYCHVFQQLYGYQLSILRFFTVYGPWGRPDMAISKFIRQILHGEPIRIYGRNSSRDYTYIDDICMGIERAIQASKRTGIYNLGYGNPVSMEYLIELLQSHFPNVQMIDEEKRQGDVQTTWADIRKAKEELGYVPSISIEEGLKRTIAWAKEYYR